MFEKGKQYKYNLLLDICSDNGLDYCEIGSNLIGAQFIVVSNEKSQSGKISSFVLTGVAGSYIYECIYND